MTLRRFAPLILLLLSAAQPASTGDGESRLRAAQDAWQRGDDATAIKLYDAAEERSQDPGLIAFNLGAIHFRKSEFRDAELQFNRALDDRDAPAPRRVRSLYNRGVCLLRRGGLTQFRMAIESFERCLASTALAPDLAADAEHNLELAKLLWLEARAKSNVKPLPNERLPEEPPPDLQPRPEPPDRLGEQAPDFADANPGSPKSGEIDPLTGQPKTDGATATKKTTGGKGRLPVTGDWAGWQPQNEAEARDYLKVLGLRLAKDRRDLLDMTAPPEQPHVKDW